MLNFVNSLRIASIIIASIMLSASIVHELVEIIKNDMTPYQYVWFIIMIGVYTVTSVIVKIAEKKEVK